MENLDKKHEANEFGKFAEELAAQNYIRQGYTILERQWRLGKTEIDLIAQKGDVIILIEVKARKSGELDALSSVTPDKRKRMIKAADAYIRKLPGQYSYRFDFVACSGNIQNYKIEVVEDAFLAADIF